ncbi:hypothetical protein H112_08759 [Trichophyton rubrum D6]|uniref:Uncharacterized protein n=3 Tax=Trichophyton TaxID=5550 RepID=A0A080WEF6_TRIRC|nr:uncharacterized protein TERG_11700 [Trichophyton rubrum CBS 118892]EZF09888.1 hypothetical protein H100_08781 [Trichophyton rubrum MR850]EZF36740.1 hypothetical protein H102_08740 [Trichophyton rubrum CBS 100081]EZF47488.1 hypothetical protein H103_08763 [Trichophyton rubrum CBS 288.86]EZF58146.1 hypothetical protein H104_08715 [Trichophyton rubrum CBS 289.86]EZF68752.1 hypothetical protein H105_08766 [Trichophyton soudanense CBS 452.61]EZF79311.1 hypothetical protein H110_08765 [Trichophy
MALDDRPCNCQGVGITCISSLIWLPTSDLHTWSGINAWNDSCVSPEIEDYKKPEYSSEDFLFPCFEAKEQYKNYIIKVGEHCKPFLCVLTWCKGFCSTSDCTARGLLRGKFNKKSVRGRRDR